MTNAVSIFKCVLYVCYFLNMAIRICSRDVFYVLRKVDLMKMAKVNAYIMHIFGKIELLYVHAT